MSVQHCNTQVLEKQALWDNGTTKSSHWHAHAHTHKQNAPQRFQVVLVATDLAAESAAVNLEIARQFAANKRLELVECEAEDQEKVDRTFLKVIDKIMTNWETGVNGKLAIRHVFLRL